jgi:hypothetical protein
MYNGKKSQTRLLPEDSLRALPAPATWARETAIRQSTLARLALQSEFRNSTMAS